MNYFFITGTSRGIGKAIVQELLLNPNNHVTGFSRTNTVSHERFSFHAIDLSDVAQVSKFEFPELNDADKICLVNNAGTLGNVKHIGHLSSQEIISTYNIGLVSPSVLTNAFLKKYSTVAVEQVIINVSSGAGKNPIDGWSIYCATKAGLDMYTRVLADELKIDGRKNIHAFAVAPGVVDTAMQDQIRSSGAHDFSRIQTFISYKNEGNLASPELVARKYLAILGLPEKYPDVLFSVKDIQ